MVAQMDKPRPTPLSEFQVLASRTSEGGGLDQHYGLHEVESARIVIGPRSDCREMLGEFSIV
jgi:hypothetical protein